jgi:hypothetical protein
MKHEKAIAIALCALAAGLLLASLKMPVWQMRMEAPQYKDEESLKVKVYPNALRGDLQELQVLNNYIGVHVPRELPQTDWLPIVLVAGAIAGLAAAFLPGILRKRALIAVPALISAALIVAAAQAQWQMYEIGNHRDHKTKLLGVKDFTTPLLGRAKIAQFTITSFLGWGALAIGGALALQLTGAWVNRKAPPASATSPSPRRQRSASSTLPGRLATDAPSA